jgi:hypothetical protein
MGRLWKWCLLAIALFPVAFMVDWIHDSEAPYPWYVYLIPVFLISSAIMIGAIVKGHGGFLFWFVGWEVGIGVVYVFEAVTRHVNPFTSENVGPLLACWGLAVVGAIGYWIVKGKRPLINKRSLLLIGAILRLLVL